VDGIQNSFNYKGWARFIIFKPEQKSKANSFFINNAYYEQLKRLPEGKVPITSDKSGAIDIPSDQSFFFVLTD